MSKETDEFRPNEREWMEEYIVKTWGWENNDVAREQLSEMPPDRLREEHKNAWEAVMAENAAEEKNTGPRMRAW